MNQELKVSFNIPYQHRVIFSKNIFSLDNPTLIESLLSSDQQTKKIKIAFFIDSGLVLAQPQILKQIKNYFLQYPIIHLVQDIFIVPGGEKAKTDIHLFEKIVSHIKDSEICRHSYVITLGGGAVLDAVGFAASVVHRGVRQIRIPSTVLAQNDAGIGIKNGIDAYGSKNFLGCFYPPDLVINDSQLLLSLSEVDWRNGTAEAIKVALIKDAAFFSWIEDHAESIAKRDINAMEKLIFTCAQLHLNHIAYNGDPFEKGSARPLDFGHWAAHKMEHLSHFELAHGHAVAIGMALDCLYAKELDYLNEKEAQRILKCLTTIGFTLWHPCLTQTEPNTGELQLLQGLKEFQEHLGGDLSVTLLKGIGRPIQVNSMDIEIIQKCLKNLSGLYRPRARQEKLNKLL